MSPATLRLRSDEHLVSLFRAGREDAFEAIHERHRRRLQATAARALRSSGGDAEGVVQEAFLRAHRALRADHRPIELKPWLHRVVRNLCIDELRRNRVSTVELEDSDRAGAGEDIYSTLSRRHELRRLIEDLADLPEQQRAALLMRELDGLSHEEVASALEVTPAASRQLVKRARSGLVAAADARDADCAAIREVLLIAHDERRRPSEHALRHMRGCTACREFRDGLKATRGRLRALIPPVGAGPLAGILSVLGGGGAAAGGTGLKVAATAACCALLAGGTATTLVVASRSGKVAGSEHVERGRATGTEAGGKALIGKPIRKGTKLPASAAIGTVLVRLNAGEPRMIKRLVRVSCPPDMLSAGLAVPRLEDGREEHGLLRVYQYSNRDMDLLERDSGRRTVTIRYAAARGLPAPVVVRVGTLCKRR